jgi:hypothetical protein
LRVANDATKVFRVSNHDVPICIVFRYYTV